MGDELTLTVGRRVSEGYDLDQSTPYVKGEETFVPVFAKTYRVVGIAERMDNVMEDRMAPGYTVVTCFDERDGSVVHPGTVDVFVRLTRRGCGTRMRRFPGYWGFPRRCIRPGKMEASAPRTMNSM